MDPAALKRTSLYDAHVALGAKIVPFAGWEMPLQYSGIIAEHQAVRTAAGLFDVSHMGEIFVRGPEASAALNYLTSNDVSRVQVGQAQYGAILNREGGVVDDIIVYRLADAEFLVCVNASNAEKDFRWFTANNKHCAEFENAGAQFGQIAIQGPKAIQITGKLIAPEVVAQIKRFHFVNTTLLGIPAIIARTGYTGEDGFELFVPWDKTVALWDHFIRTGAEAGLVPVGLGARDTLRLEACYPLHGHELGEDIPALDSDLGWVVRFRKDEFIGKQALLEQKAAGLRRKLAAFVVVDNGIARHGDKLFDCAGLEVGFVTSGTKTPTLNQPVGMALLQVDYAEVGSEVFVEVRGRRLACRIMNKPLYTQRQ